MSTQKSFLTCLTIFMTFFDVFGKVIFSDSPQTQLKMADGENNPLLLTLQSFCCSRVCTYVLILSKSQHGQLFSKFFQPIS